jgi:hypothetical protein
MTYGKINVDLIENSNGLTGRGFGPGFVNRIINGDMRIDQRNAGAAVTANGAFPVDRFIASHSTDGAFSLQQDSSAPTGFVNSIKWTTTTADGTLGATQFSMVRQKIEGTNVSDLAFGSASAKTVTLSFWVRSSLTGNFGGSITNSAQNRCYPFSYTISVADTWEQKSITIPGDTTGTWLTTTGIGIDVFWGLGVGSTYSGTAGAWTSTANLYSFTGAVSVIGTLNATWYVTGVQLEVGSSATSFDYRPYGTELSLCQRYFAKTFPQGTAIGQNQGSDGAVSISSLNPSTRVIMVWEFPVTMRASPTVTYYNPSAANAQARDLSASADCSSTGNFSVSDSRVIISTVGSASSTQGNGISVQCSASIEL